MNRREKYVSESTKPNDQVLQAWWRSASFGLALSGKAAQAVAAAEQAMLAAETAQDLVQHQAVYALLDAGHTVREAAERLKMSASKVGRIAKSMKRGGELSDIGFATPANIDEPSKALVLSAWNMEDFASLTRDHPRDE